jgi:serine protease AprX
VLLLAGLTVAGCAGVVYSGSKPDKGAHAMTEQKLFDNLVPILAQASDTDPIPVLIMARRPQDLPALEQAAGITEVKYRYSVVPAMAATVTKAQIDLLTRQNSVRHIEYDAEVTIALDGANRWFGTAQARQDFGVTGDRDGNPSSFSKNDIVMSVA